MHPLVILSTGHGQSIFKPLPTAGGTGWPIRPLAYPLVMSGFDVLVYDYEARGASASESWHTGNDWSTVYGTGNAPNIFHMIDQLAKKEPGMLAYHISDLKNPHEEKLLADSAENTPVILAGFSHGANLSTRAMQLYVDDVGGRKDKYNLRGIAEFGGLGGCIMFVGDLDRNPTDLYLGIHAVNLLVGNISIYPNSEVFASIDKWPGYLAIKGTHDGIPPDGAIAAYNRARGFKKIAMVRGFHTSFAGPNFPYAAQELIKFCKLVSLNDPDMNNTATTTLHNEIASAPYIDLTEYWNYYYEGGPEPEAEGRLHASEITLKNALERFSESGLDLMDLMK